MLSILNACTGAWNDYPQRSDSQAPPASILNVGDILTVNVYGEDNLSSDYSVETDGTITMPLAGSVLVRGLKTDEAAQVIRLALIKGGYLIDPQVIASTNRTQIFYVMGEVLNTGEFKHIDGLTLLEAVAKAGGFSYRANQSQFDIVRRDQEDGDVVIKADIATLILPGDIIRVRERLF